MIEKRQHSWWRRATSIVGLIGLLCFWTAAVAHIHDATKQGSVQQDCQLCVAGHTSHTLQSSAPATLILLPLANLSTFARERLLHSQDHHTVLSRAPPAHS